MAKYLKCVFMKDLVIVTTMSNCHIIEYVTPRYYDLFLVSQTCHIKEVGL
jgi:hypothetical protein